jgi:SET domain
MAREVSRTAAELSNIATKCGLPLSAKDARSLLYSIQCNAHQILNSKEGETGVALGLFPYTSMMNHSCSPNCIHRFLIEEGRPPRLIMRAIANIAKGEELCYSYVNLYQSTEARRSQLESAYSFICECERCTAGSSSSTGVGQSSNEAPAPLASGILHYISDAPLDEFEESYDNSKVEEIEQFVVTSAGTNDSESLSRLKDFLSGSDAGKFHPAHRVLFLCYHYISVSSFRAALKNKSTNTSTVQSIRISIGNGLLALGCMRKYVMRIQTEIGHLEELLVSAIELLITQLHSSPCTHTTNTQQEVTENTERTDDIGSEFTPICCTSSRPSDFRSTHAVLDLLFENGYLKTSYWGALGDGRVRDLVELGCGFPKGDVTAATAATLLPSSSSSSSSSGSAIEEGESESHFKAPNTACVCHEVELNILQRMLIKFRISSEYIAYVCRAEVDEVDFEEQDVP